MNKIEFWSCEEVEYLHHENKDDAIEDYLDENLDHEEIELIGYQREVVDINKFTNAVLEYASEYLSEEYDGEDGHDQNEKIKLAANNFCKTYLDNYTPWICKPIHREKVNVKDWISKNRPDWLAR